MLRNLTQKLTVLLSFNTIVRLFVGFLVCFFGIMLIANQNLTLDILTYAIIILLFATGVVNIIKYTTKKPRVTTKLILALLTVIIAIGLTFIHNTSFYVITFLFGLYLFVSSVIEFINAFLMLKNETGEFIFSLLPGIFYLVFSLLFTFMPIESNRAFYIIAGIYCILLGSTYVADFISSVIPQKAKRNIKRKIRISLPVFLAMFIPHTILSDLNKFLKKEGNELDDRTDLTDHKENENSNLEIFFHVAEKGFNSIGHCDICLDGEVITYGNYDEKAQNKIGMGPGVLITSKREEYIPFCLEFDDMTIFSFGLSLNHKQKENVKDKIKEIKKLLYYWEPPYQLAKKRGILLKNKKYKDFASNLYKQTKSTKFYKFKKGKFKTYFVMTTNCVALADYIVCKAGTDILGVSGIISPGTFYDYLQSEYLKKGSIVVEKNLYKVEENEL